MTRRPQALVAWAAVIALVGVIAAFTKGDGDKQVATTKGPTTTIAATASGPSGPGSTVATTAVADPSATTTPAGTGDTTGTTGDTTATTTVDTVPPPTTVPGTPRVMPDPGHYAESVSGTASLNGQPQQVPPTGELLIEQLSDTDQRLSDGTFDLTVRWSPDAARLVSLRIAQANKTFTPAEPVLYTAFPGVIGQSWQWTVTSSDGKTTIDQTSTVTGDDVVNVGGVDVPVFVVHTVITLSGDLTGTVTLDSWASDEQRLSVKQHAVVDATYNGVFKLKSDTTSQLVSLTPT